MPATKLFAQVVGVVLILIGVLGALLGEGLVGGLLNIDFGEDMIHVLTGGILAYVGFGRDQPGLRNAVVGTISAVYLIVGLLGLIYPPPYGPLFVSGFTVVDNLIHLALGVLGLAAVFLSRGSEPTVRRT
jgi:hypothetical protein